MPTSTTNSKLKCYEFFCYVRCLIIAKPFRDLIVKRNKLYIFIWIEISRKNVKYVWISFSICNLSYGAH